MKARISLHPATVTATLLKIVGLLLLAGLFCLYLIFGLKAGNALGFVPLFDLNGEYNIPAFYSALAIWFSAALLYYIYLHEKKAGAPRSYYWRHFSFLFIFLGIDELASIHEIFGRFAPMIWERFPWLQISRKWIIPFSPVILAMAIYFFRFFLLLSKANKLRFAMAGMVFVTGAVVIEIFGEWYANQYEMPPIFRGFSAVAEEGCEMLGIVLFIRALLMHIRVFNEDTRLDIAVVFDKIPGKKPTKENGKEKLMQTVTTATTPVVTDPGQP